MSSPWHTWTDVPPKRPSQPKEDKPKTPQSEAVFTVYKNMRLDGIELEEIIGNGEGLTAKDLKRLDKAVTVIKMGYKIIKMVLRAHGYREMKPARVEAEVQ